MSGSPEPTEPGVKIGEAPAAAFGLNSHLEPTEVRRRAIVGGMAIAVRGVLLRVIGFVGGLVLARILVPSEYGTIALAQSVVGIGAVVSGGGLGAALVGRQAEPNREELGAVFGLQLLLTVAMALVALAVGPFFGTVGVLIAIMSLAMPIDALRVVPAVMLERQLHYGPVVKSEIVDLAAFNLFAIPLVLLMGVEGVALAGVARAVAGTVVLVAASPVGFVAPRPHLRPIRGIIGFGVAFQSVGVLVVVRELVLNVSIAAIASSAVLGFWALASRLLGVVGLALESLYRVTFPSVARLLDAGENPGPFLERGLNVATLATGLFAVALACSAPALIPVVFGDRWEQTIDVLPFAAAGLLLVGPLSSIGGGYLYAVGEAGQVLRTVGAQAVTWLVVGLALLPVLDATAIGVGMFVASVVDFAYLSHSLRRHIALGIGRAMGWPFVAALVAIAAGQAVARASNPDLPGLAVALATGLAVYVAVLMVCQRAALRSLADLVHELRTGGLAAGDQGRPLSSA